MNAKRAAHTLAAAMSLAICIAPAEASLKLYVDQKTKQIYAEPGPGRIPLGTFKQVDEAKQGDAEAASENLDQMIEQKKEEIKKLDRRLKSVENKQQKADEEKKAKATADKKWHEKYTIGGYTQLRFDSLMNGANKHLLQSPTDRGIGGQNDLLLRRGRLKLSGDVSDWLSIYTQIDFASSVSGVSSTNSTSVANFAQIRDLYADIYFDKAREYRVRPGYSKVPLGWEMLQSSQNRVAFERADATDSTVIRDERDLGIFFYWSPEEAQERFKYLVKSGLRGSGDYGVFGFGYFNGQGLNRFELDGSMHTAVRLTYPFEMPWDQMMEVGVSGITGRFMNTPTALTYTPIGASAPITTTPTVLCQKNVQGGTSGGSPYGNSGGCNDERVVTHFIWYPKPFGLQAEWAWGNTPMLDDTSVQLGKPVVTGGSLNGGYVQAMYKIDHFYGSWIPYVRYEQYDGGSKFDANSPHMKTSQYEMGVEYMPLPEFQLKAAYSPMARTNLNQTGGISGLNRGLPYGYYSGNVMRLQLQWNY